MLTSECSIQLFQPSVRPPHQCGPRSHVRQPLLELLVGEVGAEEVVIAAVRGKRVKPGGTTGRIQHARRLTRHPTSSMR